MTTTNAVTGAGISAAQEEEVQSTAAAILASATTAQLENPFGSIGELHHSIQMWEKFGSLKFNDVVSSLARIARQRDLTNCDPFVWDEELLTYFIDVDRLEVMCRKLA